ncbi:PIN domain nuclease [Solitalea longa]|uniref:PIN domain nuclease n=1 Tax=Solitalea longa TaxID=2079460 RepID=A0A2S4ZZG9_9SPHI|nr:PIN domain-containing protein [Solitalea longa]POY35362.1 PIN domain nuclease [Solitalea longa]
MERIFIDTDIALDLLAKREGFYEYAAKLFTKSDKGEITLYISSLSINNLNYLLTKQHGQVEGRRILNNFRLLLNILSVDEKIIDLALNSLFSDFEDAIQYFTAIENNIHLLITRNLKDYKNAQITVMTAEMYLKLQ